jgi:hypothetical protein
MAAPALPFANLATAAATSERIAPTLDGDPGARLLLEWWQRQADATGRLPARRALDPVDFLSLLGAINLLDIEADGRLRLRLYGERVQSVNAKMYYMDELTPIAYRDLALRDYAQMIASAAPQGFRVLLTGVTGEQISYRRLLLPLADDQGAFVHILLFNPDTLDARAQRATKRLLEHWRRAEAAAADPPG